MKFRNYIDEAKVVDGDEVHFDSAGGYFSSISSRLVPHTKDNEYIVSPGVTDGGKYPIFNIVLEDEMVEPKSKDIQKALKKAADALDKVLESEMKKLGFKRTR